ncbi:MAG: tRNA epoxyqueuosine(34) reductase QueG [Acidobacteriaceae bacterium]
MPASLPQTIKDQAHCLGFSLVGITTSESLPHARTFERWLSEGRQGEMTYLDSPRSRAYRAHPRAILPECSSVLVLGVRYPAPPRLKLEEAQSQPPRGIIAAYAWGEDYHLSLPKRLRSLVAFIESQVGHPVPNRWYTDSGPLLERELGQRAGLGWIGKNTCLINPALGSYFLLAEILLGIELEPDQPFGMDRCGTCQRCITACPTGCILPDRTLDARRCISYLTIELKGPISTELRPSMGSRVFGCDICQQVCPWNRFAARTADAAFITRQGESQVDLLEEMRITPEEYNDRYRRSPVKRAKRTGYLRNIAVALGNSHGSGFVDMLEEALVNEQEPLVRLHVAWSLGQAGGARAGQALKKGLMVENDPLVRAEIQASLANV